MIDTKLYYPQYRTDYIGETINRITDGETTSYFVAPRENAFTAPYTDTAIVLGNGITKNYRETKQLLRINANKVAESYKLVYACNRAISDESDYDYYVLKHRVFLGEMPAKRKSQVYLPYDIFLDYKDDCNLIPYISQFDSGASAAYIACFDGHKKVFLMGFDGGGAVGSNGTTGGGTWVNFSTNAQPADATTGAYAPGGGAGQLGTSGISTGGSGGAGTTVYNGGNGSAASSGVRISMVVVAALDHMAPDLEVAAEQLQMSAHLAMAATVL